MALVIDDRVKETSVTTGTGTFNLDGAVSNFQNFVAGIGGANTTYYAIIHRTVAEWEVGLGTVTDAAPDTLARTEVLSSSNGDAAVNFSAGTKDVFCTLPASKTILAGGGAWTLIGTSAADNTGGTLTVTGLDSTYDTYAIAFQDLVPASDGDFPWFRVGDAGGIDSGATDYEVCATRMITTSATVNGQQSTGSSRISLTLAGNGVGNAAGEGLGGLLFLHRPGDGTMRPTLSGTITFIDNAGVPSGFVIHVGERSAVITLDRVQFIFPSGNIVSGRMTVWGVSHA